MKSENFFCTPFSFSPFGNKHRKEKNEKKEKHKHSLILLKFIVIVITIIIIILLVVLILLKAIVGHLSKQVEVDREEGDSLNHG